MKHLSSLSYKTIFTIFFFAIAGIIFFLKIGSKNITKVSATWWNSSWNYRRSISVTNSTGIGQTNITVKILSNYDVSSLVSASKLQSDLDDLRFTDTNNNLIGYWIEDATNTSVDVWAIIPSFPSGVTSLWLYYGNSSATAFSLFSYTGSSQTLIDADGQFRVKFLSSGTLTPTVTLIVDAFLVGGGSSLGGSGYTTNGRNANLAPNTPYNIIIGAGGSPGANGAASTAFGYTANPGNGGNGGSGRGESGYTWSGGNGGSDGSNGYSSGSASEGVGQGTTTREFGDSTGTLYAGGGGGGGGWEPGYSFNGGAGGAGGGGNGQGSSTAATSGAANTGGGAGVGIRGESFPAYGGSGIVVIRLSLRNSFFSYTGSSQIIIDSNGQLRVKLLTSGTFIPTTNLTANAFLVGGGGGGMTWNSSTGAGGGGGGYTLTVSSASLQQNTSYSIVVGAGGSPGGTGGTTSAFGSSANGGLSGNGGVGSNGGSGGGGYPSGWGGSNGSNGANSNMAGGIGQGTTTQEFGEAGGTIYSYGGNAAFNTSTNVTGGAGCSTSRQSATSGVTNSGSGGGGGGYDGAGTAYGGSGIVVIRFTNPGTVAAPSTNEQTPSLSIAGICLVQESANDTQLSLTWSDISTDENGYSIQRSLNGASWTDLTNISAGSTAYTDTTVSKNNTYQYRISPYYTGVTPTNWCYTSTLNLGQGNFNVDGLNLDGVNLD